MKYSLYRFLLLSLLLGLLAPPNVVQAQAPTVTRVSLVPAANAIAAPRATTVQVPFSQNIDPATAPNIKVFSPQYRGRRTATASTSGSTVTLTPTVPATGSQVADFRPGETVAVSVPATVKSTGGVAATPYVYQFVAAASGGMGTFGGTQNPSVGALPISVTLGDLDGDGDLDLVTANNSTTAGTASVRFNDGTGTFSGSTDISVGKGPRGVALGDLNGDGALDLLTANLTGNSVSVRFNDGTGTFTGTTDVSLITSGSTNPQPQSVAVGDVDGDGDLDFVTANNNGGASVRLNDGSGGFSGTTLVSLGANGGSPTAVTLGDADGDGKLDLFVASYNSNYVNVRLNDGLGNFSGGSDVATGSKPTSVALGDLNGDGALDLIAANYIGNTVSVRFNNGSGTFSGTTDVGVGGNPRGVALADVDGDGDLDLLAASIGGSVGVRINNGSGVFSGTANPSANTPYGLAVGDVDGDSDLDFVTSSNTATGTVSVRLNTNAVPVLTSLMPNSRPVGTSITLMGTSFIGATGVKFGTTAATTFAVVNSTTATATVPTGATTGNVTITTPIGTSNGVTFTVTTPSTWTGGTGTDWFTASNWNPTGVPGTGVDVVIPTVSSGNYPTIGTNAAIASARSLTLNAGAALTMTDNTLDLRGNFTNNGTFTASGGTVALGATAAASLLGSSATRFFNLTVGASGAQLSTSASTSIQRLLALNSTLTTGGNPFTLESSAAGTAMVVNTNGVVSGNVTVQRYIDASGNTGTTGYRHYSTPVDGALVSSLSTSAYGGSFTAQTNTAYNTADPNQLTLATYPNVFSYDESKIATSPATSFSDFDKGYQSPALTSSTLTTGRGYAVQIGNTEKVQFTGPLNNSNITIGGLTRAAANTPGAASAGWALIGNPYPAPLDWGTVGAANTGGSGLTNVDAAAYIFQSLSAYSGQYKSFNNGVGAGTGLIAMGQGFFVHTTTANTTGSILLTNSNRATTYTNPAFQRQAETRPLVRLSLGLGSAPATAATAQDETFVYFEAGATDAFDGKYDAYKLNNPSGYYLGSVTPGTSPTGLSIDGRAPLAAATLTEIPLWVSLPAGTYTLTATELLNFATLSGGTQVQLRDALLGTLTDLTTTPSYTFAVAANASYAGRFSLVFRTSQALAAASAQLAQTQASLYPNPAASATMLSVTGLPTAVASIQVDLLDVLGRAVGRYTLPARAGSAAQSLTTGELVGSLYLLRLTARDAQGQTVGTLPAQRLLLTH
ncbi:MAG: beta strand repeat-containing protein [Janthinobacterium lividum]